ncbi:hypothetical protein NKH19_26080 [Mesorhizobium sp. M1338]|uniref:hypothetical protein n=1 Tax=unclassified Mesorhizobium TaxID=325217 RepID=UPI0033368414
MFQWEKSCSYDEQQKRRFHTTARARLRRLATELGLSPGSFDIRSNKAGVAVSGEVTLHHDRAYIQIGQFGLSSGHGIMIRTCKSREDYTGGSNHFVALTMLDDIPALAATVHAITGVGPENSSASGFRAAWPFPSQPMTRWYRRRKVARRRLSPCQIGGPGR